MISTIQAFPTTDGIFVVWEVAAMIRDCLEGELGARLLALLAGAKKDKVDVYVALYELNDPELIAALTALKGKAHVVLGNSTGKSDATAKETEKNAGVLKKAGVDI